MNLINKYIKLTQSTLSTSKKLINIIKIKRNILKIKQIKKMENLKKSV